MVPPAARLAMLAALSGAAVGGFAPAGQAQEDGLVLIRCTGFQVPVIAFPGTEIIGQRTETEPFDVVLQPSRNIGWFRGAFSHVGPDRPAVLTMAAESYTLRVEHRLDRQVIVEHLRLDRVDGSLIHSTQSRGSPVAILKSGGSCHRIERRF